MHLETDRITAYKLGTQIESNKIKYFQEYYVLAVLKYLYPDEFDDWFKDEKPDLQSKNKNRGIEVVQVINPTKAENYSFFAKKPEKVLEERSIKKFRGNGCRIVETPCGTSLVEGSGYNEKIEKGMMVDAIKKKIKKISEYDENAKNVGLAILLIENPVREMEESIPVWIREIDGIGELDDIYVICHRFCIRYNVSEGEFVKKTIRSDTNIGLQVVSQMTTLGEITIDDIEWN